MDEKQFGAVALQLMEAAQIPGAHLDMAVEFRRIARDLAAGRLTFGAEKPAPASPHDAP